MSWPPFVASCTLVCPAVTMDMSGSLALRAAVDRLAAWVWLLFNMEGMSPSICMNGEVIIMEVVYDALSCKVGRGCVGNEGKFPQVPNGIQDAMVDGSGDGSDHDIVPGKDRFGVPGNFFKPLLVGHSF